MATDAEAKAIEEEREDRQQRLLPESGVDYFLVTVNGETRAFRSASSRCGLCMFFDALGDDDWRCEHPFARERDWRYNPRSVSDSADTIRPEWCPLLRGPTLVTLRTHTTESTHD